MPTIAQKLPKNPNDEDEILDNFGNRYQYDAQQDSWIYKGNIIPPPLVTETSDGLVDTATYQRLQNLKTVYQSGSYKFDPLKILPGRDAYWYYLKSTDKAYKFIPEGDSRLRIEVDRGHLYRVFKRSVCKGPVGLDGLKGNQGAKGPDGLPEPCYAPSVSGSELSFSVYVATPGITNISIRLFGVSLDGVVGIQRVDQFSFLSGYLRDYGSLQGKLLATKAAFNNSALGVRKLSVPALSGVYSNSASFSLDTSPSVSIEVDLAGKVVGFVNSSSLVIDRDRTIDSIRYDHVSGVLSGSFVLADFASWVGEWCVKVRQRGVSGDQGDSGDCAVSVVDDVIDNTNLLATCPIVNLRLDGRGILFWRCADILSDTVTENVVLRGGASALNSSGSLDSVFAAAQMTVDDAKSVHRFSPELVVDEVDDPEFVHWEPQAGCVTKRNYNRHKFNWVPSTVAPACNNVAQWYSPSALRNLRYPEVIVTSPVPVADSCCQDDFFYLPNIQNGVCPSPSSAAASATNEALVNGGPLGFVSFGATNYQLED